MNLSSEIIKQGRVTIYSDTPEQTEKSVLEYNALMDRCRFSKKQLGEIELGYTVFNPVVIIAASASTAEVTFEKPALALVILLLNAAVFVLFAVFKKNYIVSTAAASLLMICNPIFAFVFVTDIIITVMHASKTRMLKKQLGYPAFTDITVTYERHPAPKN